MGFKYATSPAAQPNVEGPKCARRENGYHSISSAVAYNLGSHSPKKFYRQKSSSAYNHCAECGASVLIHIILGHDAQIERIRRRLRNRYFKLVSLTVRRERTKLR